MYNLIWFDLGDLIMHKDNTWHRTPICMYILHDFVPNSHQNQYLVTPVPIINILLAIVNGWQCFHLYHCIYISSIELNLKRINYLLSIRKKLRSLAIKHALRKNMATVPTIRLARPVWPKHTQMAPFHLLNHNFKGKRGFTKPQIPHIA